MSYITLRMEGHLIGFTKWLESTYVGVEFNTWMEMCNDDDLADTYFINHEPSIVMHSFYNSKRWANYDTYQ